VAKVARWVGVPLGTQLGMFSDDGDRHFDAGRRAALDDEPCRRRGRCRSRMLSAGSRAITMASRR
jgi:hypothetical protein